MNTGTSLKVQYTYTEMASSANHSRLKTTVYPNGRILRAEYSAGDDTTISRISYLADDNSGSVGTHLEDYSYLGLGRIVKRAHPEPGVDLTYIKQAIEATTDAADQYTGLDRFGRIIDQRWRKNSDGSHLDRWTYAYDRAGNKLYKKNENDSTKSELYHGNGVATQSSYDPLGRLTAFQRGTLSASGSNGATLDQVSTLSDPNVADPVYGIQSWTLDQINNWASVTSDGAAVGRTHNSQNQLTGNGTTTWGYDNNGNLTTQTGKTTNTWDAWNRGTSIRATTYQYDGLGRRVKETTGATSRRFYHTGWQAIETRMNALTRADEQFVFSLAYMDATVVRDRDADASSATGSLGTASSGLEERMYYSCDREFNVSALLSVAGAVLERIIYDPYGDRSMFDSAWTSRASSSYSNSVGFTGRWHDASGFVYFRSRYYDADVGRFVSRDMASYADGCSLYAAYFVPSGIDPTGLRNLTPAEEAILAALEAEARKAAEAARQSNDMANSEEYAKQVYESIARAAGDIRAAIARVPDNGSDPAPLRAALWGLQQWQNNNQTFNLDVRLPGVPGAGPSAVPAGGNNYKCNAFVSRAWGEGAGIGWAVYVNNKLWEQGSTTAGFSPKGYPLNRDERARAHWPFVANDLGNIQARIPNFPVARDVRLPGVPPANIGDLLSLPNPGSIGHTSIAIGSHAIVSARQSGVMVESLLQVYTDRPAVARSYSP